MGLHSSVRWVVVVGALLGYASSPAGAQQGAGSAAPPAPPAPNAQVGFQRRAQLAPEEQVAEGGRQLARMSQAAGTIRRMLETARGQRDVVKALCLNDKLSQVDVAVRSGRDRGQQLEAAAGRKDGELANHEFTILTVLRQRVDQLSGEAGQCVGEEAAFVGETSVTTTVDPAIPPDDAPYPVTQPSSIVNTPPCTSCTF